MIPNELKRFEVQIRAADPTKQAIDYPVNTWRRHLGTDEDLEYVAQVYPSPITRGDLFRLAGTAKAFPILQNVRRLFVGNVLFGYGTVGYGPWRTEIMLSTPNAGSVLQKAFELVLEHRVEEAYGSFQLKYCGSSFVTKFLYFAGFGGGMDEYPLILDSNVEEALKSRIGVAMSQFVNTSRWYPQGDCI